MSYCPTAARGVVEGIGDRALRHLSLFSGIEAADVNTSDEFPWPRCPECGARVVSDT